MFRWAIQTICRIACFFPRCVLGSSVALFRIVFSCDKWNGLTKNDGHWREGQDRVPPNDKDRRTKPSVCRVKSLMLILSLLTGTMLLTTLQFTSTSLKFNAFFNDTEFTSKSEIQMPRLTSPAPVVKTQLEIDKEMFMNHSSLFKMPIVNCANMFKGVKHALSLGIQIAKDNKKKVKMLSNDYYINLTKNCDKFKRTRGYITSSLSQQENEFPLAYSIITYKDIEMVERLLRTIYRPQNFYCIHADLKADKRFAKALGTISECFPNVFVSSKSISVQWGTFSVLEPELICMKELYAKGSWKYFINLTGQEMPLKTNLELVKILTAYQGANDVESTVKRANKERWKGIPPPMGIRPGKGSLHIAVNRQFVDYILHNDTAAKLLDWVKKTDIPDETFFTMLNHNPQLGIPGTYPGWPETDNSNRKPFLARFKNWGTNPFKYPCAGYWTRGICIWSTGDLPLLGKRPELFANKFHLYEDRVVIGCLEEKLFNDTRDEFLGLKQFNTTLYEGLGFVLNQVGKNNTDKFVPVANAVSSFV